MDEEIQKRIVLLYKEGFSVRKISKLLKGTYKRERIRIVLHKNKVAFRGIGAIYRNPTELNEEEIEFLCEFLGYMYGDGCLTRNNQNSTAHYSANLTFALNQLDLVERVRILIKKLYGYNPRVIIAKNTYSITLRASVAKHIAKLGYPQGKKSVINPNFPMSFLNTINRKIFFIRGFLNAEATVNETIAVQQSVRISLTISELDSIPWREYTYPSGYTCRYAACSNVTVEIVRKVESNMLMDLKKLLADVGIETAIYPVRAYNGKSNATSIHFELQILRQHLKTAYELQIVTCKNKWEKLQKLRGRARAWKMG